MFKVVQYELDEAGDTRKTMFCSYVLDDCWAYVDGRYSCSNRAKIPATRLYVIAKPGSFCDEPADIVMVRKAALTRVAA